MKIWIISDIHEDITRLREWIKILEERKCEKLICLWDLVWVSVPYYWYMQSRDSNSVVNVIKEKCEHIVSWNHDLYCTKTLPTSSPFQFPNNRYDLSYPEKDKLAWWKIWLNDTNELESLLTHDNISFLKKLDQSKLIEVDWINILISHRIYPDLWGVTKNEFNTTSSLWDRYNYMSDIGATINLVWHSHKHKRRFSRNWIADINFWNKYYFNIKVEWFILPCTCNWTFANGVTVLDTKEKYIELVPLWTTPHKIPDWNYL